MIGAPLSQILKNISKLTDELTLGRKLSVFIT